MLFLKKISFRGFRKGFFRKNQLSGGEDFFRNFFVEKKEYAYLLTEKLFKYIYYEEDYCF